MEGVNTEKLSSPFHEVHIHHKWGEGDLARFWSFGARGTVLRSIEMKELDKFPLKFDSEKKCLNRVIRK